MNDAYAALCRSYLGTPEVDDKFFAGALDVEGAGTLKLLRRAHSPSLGGKTGVASIQVGPLLVDFESMNPLCLLDLANADGLAPGSPVAFRGKLRHLDQWHGRVRLGRLVLGLCAPQEPCLMLRIRHTGGAHVAVGDQVLAVPSVPADYFRLLPSAEGGFLLEPGVR